MNYRANLKQDGQAFYLVRETKGTVDFLKLRITEAVKVRCGQRLSRDDQTYCQICIQGEVDSALPPHPPR